MIYGGFYIKARKIQRSWIAQAPPHIREIWDWILLSANYKDNGDIKRGQLLTTYKDIQEGLAWFVGYRKQTYKKHHCEIAMKALTREHMITTRKTTRGLVITVLNYDKYQDPKSYECYSENYNKATMKLQGTDTIRKERERKEEGNKPTASENAVRNGGSDSYKTKKGRKLTGECLEAFNRFWKTFGYAKGKAEAADSWITVYSPEIVEDIIAGAEKEARERQKLIENGRTPKWAQGWLSGRRWEDEAEEEVSEWI